MALFRIDGDDVMIRDPDFRASRGKSGQAGRFWARPVTGHHSILLFCTRILVLSGADKYHDCFDNAE
jgi:hypothetical protein